MWQEISLILTTYTVAQNCFLGLRLLAWRRSLLQQGAEEPQT
jgi:hypothetical protein